MENVEGAHQLVLTNLEQEDDSAVKKFKTACLVDLELSVDDVLAILNGERNVLRIGSTEELAPFAALLTKCGATVEIAPETQPNMLENEETVVLELDDIIFSEQKSAKQREYVLDIGESQDELDFSPDSDELTDEDSAEESELEQLLNKLDQPLTPQSWSPDLPKKSVASSDLELGPPPEELLFEPVKQDELDEEDALAVSPAKPEDTSDLNFSFTSEEVVQAPATPVKAIETTPPTAPQPTVKFSPQSEVSAMVVTAKPQPAVTPDELSDVDESPEVFPKIQVASRRSSARDFSLSFRQTLGLFVVGLTVLLGTNFLFFSEPSEPVALKLTASELPADEADASVKQPTLAAVRAQSTGALRNNFFSAFVTVTKTKKGPVIKFSLVSPEPPPQSKEQIVRGESLTPWIRRLDGEPILLTPYADALLTGSGPLFAFVEQGSKRQRIPVTALITAQPNEMGEFTSVNFEISYTPQGDVQLPPNGKLAEVSGDGTSYRIFVSGEIPIKN